jgi:hypothetical protein
MELIEIKNKVRPLLGRLEGYLKNPPLGISGDIYESTVWEQYNRSIQELNNVTGEDFDGFLLHPKSSLYGQHEQVVSSETFKFSLSGLIEELKAHYFIDELKPDNNTGIHISQSQSQTQEMHIQILLDMQSLIDKKMQKFPNECKERTFLEKVKGTLSGIKNISDLMLHVLSVGKSVGLSAEELYNIFS